MDPEVLAQVLRPLQEKFPKGQYPDVLVGLGQPDDAAVLRLTNDLAVIHTLDFFTPVVDDAYTFGAVAATNAMSDVWAMGGEVRLALNIAGFPANVPPSTIAEVFRGGADKAAEAGAVVAGGHTMESREPMFGMSVMGTIHPADVVTKGGARPGDRLLLTKPLGVGVITTALKQDRADPEHVDAAVDSMMRLNGPAARAMVQAHAHAATDITGFGLLGHGREMAEASRVTLHFHLAALPFLPGARDYARAEVFPGGTYRNAKYYGEWVRFGAKIPEPVRLLLFSPETSGGLLIALAPGSVLEAEAALKAGGQAYWLVGEVAEGEGTLEVLP